MDVLVVHDRPEIGNQIVTIVRNICDGVNVIYCEDGSSARSLLAETYFDLLIIDLTLPMLKGGRSAGFVVAEGLLEELFGSDTLMAPGNTLGITQDKSALSTVQNNIGPHLMAIVEQSDLTDWESQLSDRIKYVQYSSNSRNYSALNRYDYDVLIITALDKELHPYKDSFELTPHPLIDGVEVFIFSDGKGMVRRGACFAIGRAGQPSASSETQGLLCQLRPKLAIMTGFCGGVPGKAKLGDILIAESTTDWDYGKWKPGKSASRLYSRPEPIVIRNSKVHRIARSIKSGGVQDDETLRQRVFKLTNGEVDNYEIDLIPFASGSAVIGDEHVVDSIRELNDAIGGVDMESYGFYYACRYSHTAKPEFICIKAVADECGPDKDDRLHEGCSYASAFVAHDIIKKWVF
jgi:nucleoside phosphorylase